MRHSPAQLRRSNPLSVREVLQRSVPPASTLTFEVRRPCMSEALQSRPATPSPPLPRPSRQGFSSINRELICVSRNFKLSDRAAAQRFGPSRELCSSIRSPLFDIALARTAIAAPVHAPAARNSEYLQGLTATVVSFETAVIKTTTLCDACSRLSAHSCQVAGCDAGRVASEHLSVTYITPRC